MYLLFPSHDRRFIVKGKFPIQLQKHCWIEPMQKPDDGSSLHEGIRRYILYIKRKGPEWKMIGPPFNQEEVTGLTKRNKSELIIADVKKGLKMSQIVMKYPGCYNQICKLMRYREPRSHRTDVVYYWGPPGTGKTTTIMRILKTIYSLYPEVDYYCKLGGLDKWFDGYDNQKIVYIDDPIPT